MPSPVVVEDIRITADLIILLEEIFRNPVLYQRGTEARMALGVPHWRPPRNASEKWGWYEIYVVTSPRDALRGLLMGPGSQHAVTAMLAEQFERAFGCPWAVTEITPDEGHWEAVPLEEPKDLI